MVDTPEPIHFELWNKTETTHEVEVTIRDERDNVVLARTYDIEDSSAGPPGGNVIREEAFAEAVDGTRFDTVAVLDRRSTWEHRFRVMCNDRELENVFLVEITSGREPSLTFEQPVCG